LFLENLVYVLLNSMYITLTYLTIRVRETDRYIGFLHG